MVSALRTAAEAAYLEAPSTDSHAAEFLVATMEGNCHDDAHEEAFRLAKLLTDHGYDRRDVYGCTGIVAFAVNEFDLAEKWLRIAKESNSLARYRPPWNEIAVRALNSCPSCRKAWEKEQAIRAAEAKADKSPETWLPRILLKTSKGEIELELFENEAPNTVANFVAMAQDGAFNRLPFYTVIAGAWAEAGGQVFPDGKVYALTLFGCDPPSRAHFRGSVTLTTPVDDRGGGTSQFSILFLPKPSLNGKNTCIGRVVRGMEVLSRLQRINPDQFDDLKPDGILETKVLRKRNHAYELRKPPTLKPTPKPTPTPTPKPTPTPTAKP
jgi:cyclophilin family peptidyl-prolyl cis-trans isomerase